MLIKEIIAYMVGYDAMGLMTFFFSFYIEGKEDAAREGDYDPEEMGYGVRFFGCLAAWPFYLLVLISELFVKITILMIIFSVEKLFILFKFIIRTSRVLTEDLYWRGRGPRPEEDQD